MNVCENEIRDAIEAELVAANEKHPPFASLHEAYAVTLEELEEAEKEIKRYRKFMKKFWKCIKNDDVYGALEISEKMEYTGIRLAMKASQMVAMNIKTVQSIAAKMEWEENENDT